MDVGKICRTRKAKGAVTKSGFLVVEGLYANHDLSRFDVQGRDLYWQHSVSFWYSYGLR
jgi:hypothetical protein